MGGGKSSGSADQSGMYMALASAQAADKAYQYGTDQLNWTKQVWNAEQPMVQQVVNADVASQQQQNAFAADQKSLYDTTYKPLEQSYAQQAEQWASPGQQAINAGAAESNVATASEAGRNAATQQLESFGVNPGSTRFAGLDIGSRTAEAAATAGAGTTATQATKLQGLGLEAGVVNTGRGLPNTVAGLASTATGAGTAAAGTSQNNLSTGSNAMSGAGSWYNTGAQNMGVYTGAVNSYNQTQLGYAQTNAALEGSMFSGLGSAAGLAAGMMKLEDGGGVLPLSPTTPYSGSNPGNVSRSPGELGAALPISATTGGVIPAHTSPSAGQTVDDVPARLTVGEFVIPKDVVEWEGQKYFYGQIDKTRAARDQAHARTDIGGKQGAAIPAAPTFISGPAQQNTQGVIPNG